MSVQAAASIDIVVPVGPRDDSCLGLLKDLSHNGFEGRVFLVFDHEDGKEGRLAPACLDSFPGLAIHAWFCSGGRARKMNMVGFKPDGQGFLWFLHGDTRLCARALAAAHQLAKQGHSKTLYFFDLAFAPPRPRSMWINRTGVDFRAGLLKIPFGDQGFLMGRELFREVGGFPESVAYGEDHVFTWIVRLKGHPLKRIPVRILTSSRKYQTQGWGVTTWRHLSKTLVQASPFAWRLAAKKLKWGTF